MNDSIDENGIFRREDGSIESAIERDGFDVFVRFYHRNGRVAKEIPLARDKPLSQRLVNGTVKAWDEAGNLIGSYEISMGTGEALDWYTNGKIKSSVYMIGGVPNGRIQMWDEMGTMVSEGFMVAGRLLSSKKYRQACDNNQELPRYD